MPNWVYCNMTVSGKKTDIDCFLDDMRLPDVIVEGEKKSRPFSFNRILPMPAALQIESGSVNRLCFDVFRGNVNEVLTYPWVQKEGITTVEQLRQHVLEKHSDAIERANVIHSNIEKYGAATWYEWCNQHWDTKWDACSVSVERNSDKEVEIRFDTAWSFPLPVIRELISLYPELTFDGACSEESNAFYGDFNNNRARFWEPKYKGNPPDDDASDDDVSEYYSAGNMLDPDDKEYVGNVDFIDMK